MRLFRSSVLYLLPLTWFTLSTSVCHAHDRDLIEALIPASSATHTAKVSGKWSEVKTWGGGVPSANAKVRIPEGISVEYDIAPDDPRAFVRIAGIRIEKGGELFFPSAQSTTLTVDTIVGLPGSTFSVGREWSPLLPEHTVNIVFDSGGVGSFDRRATDTKQFGLGALFVGNTVGVYGDKKTPFRRSVGGAAAGSSTLTLDGDPAGWRVGDSIVVTATFNSSNARTQELRTIKGIVNRQITLSEALVENHTPGVDNVPVFVANLTRNVVLRSKGGLKTPIYHRAHMMMMDAGNYFWQGASFLGMGRTNKAAYMDSDGIPYDNGYFIEFRKNDQGVRLPGPGTNFRGRYPAHVHFAQLDPATSEPAVITGCSVWDSPGWGYASHQSYAHFIDNVAYDVQGAHYVFEDGNELGAARGNIGILTRGWRDPHWHKSRVLVADFGHINVFWFQGRAITVEDNVAVGDEEGEAFAWFHRNYFTTVGNIKVRDIEGLPLDAAEAEPNLSLTRDGVPLQNVRGNRVVGAQRGFLVIKANPVQPHDFRTHITDTEIYNVSVEGAHIEYTSRYTIENFLAIQQKWTQPDPYGAGIHMGNNTFQFVLKNIKVKGFAYALHNADLQERFPLDTDDLSIVDGHSFNSAGAEIPITISKYNGGTVEAWPLPQPFFKFYKSSDLLSRLEIVDPNGYERPLQTSFKRADGSTDNSWWNYELTFPNISKKDSLPMNDWTQPEAYSQLNLFVMMRQGHFTLPDGRKWLPAVILFTDRLSNAISKRVLYKIILPAAWQSNTNGLGPNLGTPDPPRVTKQPTSVSTTAGQSVTFSFEAVGELLPLEYRWTMNGVDIPNSRYSTLRLPKVSIDKNGAKIVARACNYFGCAESTAAVINVANPPPPGPPSGLRLTLN